MKTNKLSLLSILLVAMSLASCATKDSISPTTETPSTPVSSTQTSSSTESSSSNKIIIDSPEKTKLQIGETIQLTYKVEGEVSTSNIVWSSSDSSVLSVSPTGLVKALTSGNAAITAKSLKIESNPVALSVQFVPVESLSLKNPPKTIDVSQTITLETSILPEEANQNVEISSSSDALDINSKDKTIKARKYDPDPITINVYASKDFSKVQSFTLNINSSSKDQQITISFDTGEFAPLSPMKVDKGSVVSPIDYDPFKGISDEKRNNIVFLGFFYDSKYVKPATFPLTSTYADMTLYARFQSLNSGSGSGYDWVTEDNSDGTLSINGINTYQTVTALNFNDLGIPAYIGGKKVTAIKSGLSFSSDLKQYLNYFAFPSTLTEISSNFLNYSNVRNIYLPSNSLKKIDKSLFSGCKKLENIYIPDSVTSIGDNAFADCQSLKSIHLPKNLETVGEASFSNCESLEELDFTSVKTIGDSAFLGASKLKRIHFPANLEKLGVVSFINVRGIERIDVDPANPYYSSDEFGAFYNKDKTIIYMYPNGRYGTNVKFPENLETIYDNAFAGTHMSTIKIPNTVTSLEYHTFYNSPSLTAVYLPKSIQTVKSSPFALCDIKKLVLYTGYKEGEIPAVSGKSGWVSDWNSYVSAETAESEPYQVVYNVSNSDFIY